MASKSKMLRDDYVAGYEIVTLDGEHPVLYVPRSCVDKSPWVRAHVKDVEYLPFRYHAGELKSIGTRATNEYTACQHHSGCKHTRAGMTVTDSGVTIVTSRDHAEEIVTEWKRAGVAAIIADGKAERAQRPDFSEAYNHAEESLRAMGALDQRWYEM
jgi:hypothetical protein